MKITAGLGSADEYIRFVEAGADEFSADLYRIRGRKSTELSCRSTVVRYCVIMCSLGRSVNWKFCQK